MRVMLGCVCGSDLWYYRGESPHAAGSIGHEFTGIIEQAGAGAQGISPGDLTSPAAPSPARTRHE